MLSSESKIENILIISLSNIGDIVLTFPVVDILRDEFPKAEITVLVGPKGDEFFKNNPYINRVISYNKKRSPGKMMDLMNALRSECFDLAVDLRNTAIPFFISPKYKTPYRATKQKGAHKKDQHLNRLRTILQFNSKSRRKVSLNITDDDKNYVKDLLDEKVVKEGFVVIAPGAANHNKRWSYEKMAQLADHVTEKYKKHVVFVGDDDDKRISILIMRNMKNEAIDLSGSLSLVQLAELINKSDMFIGNDSAPMHIASYLEKPILAIFGPTDPKLYGPWSAESVFLQNQNNCRACKDSNFSHHDCIRQVTVDEAIQAFKINDKKIIFK